MLALNYFIIILASIPEVNEMIMQFTCRSNRSSPAFSSFSPQPCSYSEASEWTLRAILKRLYCSREYLSWRKFEFALIRLCRWRKAKVSLQRADEDCILNYSKPKFPAAVVKQHLFSVFWGSNLSTVMCFLANYWQSLPIPSWGNSGLWS